MFCAISMAYSQSNVTQSDTPFSFHIHRKSVVKMKEKVETILDAVVAELATPVASWTPFFPSEALDAILASVRTSDVSLRSHTKAIPFNTNEVRLLPAVIVLTLILVYARF
jgi:hypothetical protein